MLRAHPVEQDGVEGEEAAEEADAGAGDDGGDLGGHGPDASLGSVDVYDDGEEAGEGVEQAGSAGGWVLDGVCV